MNTCLIILIISSSRADTILPLSKPVIGRDGAEINEVLVPNGTQIIVNIWGANRVDAIWGEDSAEWKPERWLTPLPDSVTEARLPGVYSNMLVFFRSSIVYSTDTLSG